MKTNELNRHLEVLDCEHCYLRDLCKGPAAVRCLLLGEAADALEGLHKRIEELEAERRWISVTERLPEIGDQCIVAVKYKYDHEKQYTYDTDVATYTFDGGYIDDCWDTYNDWDEGQQFLHVTHRMPLPESPGEG